MNRITEKQLKALVDRINEATGSPMLPYENGKAQVGNYHLSFAYGGVNLERMHNEGGGVSCPLGLGHRPKRELWDQMHAFLAGIDAKVAA